LAQQQHYSMINENFEEKEEDFSCHVM
jgi:hypothetical protein